MKIGKKIGIVALILTVLLFVLAIIQITQAPEIPDEVYELVLKDQEAANEKMEEIFNNGSTIYKISDKATTILGFASIITSIISLILMIKNKEKGKIFPILLLIFIIILNFVVMFSVADLGKAFEAGFNQAMEQNQ